MRDMTSALLNTSGFGLPRDNFFAAPLPPFFRKSRFLNREIPAFLVS
jgi:hypothetical protein